MDRHLDADVRRLSDGWQLALTEAGQWQTPSEIDAAAFIPAAVPGTVAAALAAAGRFDPANPVPLQDHDAWYRCRLHEPAGPALLRLDGLATIADIFLNGALIGHGESMYVALELPIDLTGDDELVLRFAALTDALNRKGPRALWRPRLLDHQGLRLVRTTLLGHMPGWCPSIQAVGPYRPVSVIRPGQVSLGEVRIAADLTEDGSGLLAVSCTGAPAGALLRCAGVTAPWQADGERAVATLVIPGVRPWWPATHGEPALHEIDLVTPDGVPHLLGRTGFRHLEFGDGPGWAVEVNGEAVFCRGAVWTTADLLGLGGERATYDPLLRRLAAAGVNLLRVPGIALYEAPAFHDLCDELGIMVLVDFMFANFDYPAGEENLAAAIDVEVRQFLLARQASPSLIALTAGSEIAQQAAMLGLPPQRWYSTLATQTLPELVAEYRPDVAYLPGSPSGGALPFSVDAGIGHYYGVGAYQRGLDDARRADVGFATECLAFANLPDDPVLLARLAAADAADPCWKLGVPQDPGTDWDFADARDHYVQELYDLDPDQLRHDAPEAYLAFGRAAVAEVASETFTEWRRAGSSCRGALVFALADPGPGAGWGILDVRQQPKSIFRSLARAWRPVWIGLTDEGVNGLRLQLTNETAEDVAADVELFGLHDGTIAVGRAGAPVTIPARSTVSIAATDLYQGFFDYSYAYRFGPAAHEVTVARLRVGSDVVSEAFAFPLGRAAALAPAAISARVAADDHGWTVDISTDRFAQSVHIEADGFEVSDDWFHLAPGTSRVLRLTPLPGAMNDRPPTGRVRALVGEWSTFSG